MKTALVTGSTTGIGAAIASQLENKQFEVYRNSNNLNKKIDNVIVADLSTELGVWTLSYHFLKNKILIDALVLNVGVTDRTRFGYITSDSWNYVMNTNLTFPMVLVQQLAPIIKENGSIIFISSVMGQVARAKSISYGVSKGAISILVEYLAKEFSSKNISVNAVAPGFIATRWHNGKSIEQLDEIKAKIPARRFGSPSDVAKLVLSIIGNKYITGQTITIDGGYSLT